MNARRASFGAVAGFWFLLAAVPVVGQTLSVAPNPLVKGQDAVVLISSSADLTGATVTANGSVVEPVEVIDAHLLCAELEGTIVSGALLRFEVHTVPGGTIGKDIPIITPITPAEALSAFSTSMDEIRTFMREGYRLLVNHAVEEIQSLARTDAPRPISAALEEGLHELDTFHSCVGDAMGTVFGAFRNTLSTWLATNPGREALRRVRRMDKDGGDLLKDGRKENDKEKKEGDKEEEDAAKEAEKLKEEKEKAIEEIAGKPATTEEPAKEGLIEKEKKEVDGVDGKTDAEKKILKDALDELKRKGTEAIEGETDKDSVKNAAQSLKESIERVAERFCLMWVYIVLVTVQRAKDADGNEKLTSAAVFFYVSSHRPITFTSRFEITMRGAVSGLVITDSQAGQSKTIPATGASSGQEGLAGSVTFDTTEDASQAIVKARVIGTNSCPLADPDRREEVFDEDEFQ